MTSFAVVETIANVTSGTCAVGATMDMNPGGHIYIASNTQSGIVNVVDTGTDSVVAAFAVGARPLGIGIRMWPR